LCCGSKPQRLAVLARLLRGRPRHLS
jgi:hypothetical protein